MLYPIQNDVRNRLDLSGLWDFQPDPGEQGERTGWPRTLPAPRPLAVPGSWNEQYEDLFNYFGLGWYLKRFFVPAGWKGQRLFLRVGSANYLATVYLNGEKLGGHEGGHLPFAFEVTDRLKWDAENVLAISVENHLRPTRVPSGRESADLPRDGSMPGYPATDFDFFPFAGLHRPVVLYSVPPAFIDDLTVVTDLKGAEGSVQVTVCVNGKVSEGRVVLTGGPQVVAAPLRFREGVAQASLVVTPAQVWSEADPFLYSLQVTAGADRYALPVGIRTVAVRAGQILLNGKPVFLKGCCRHEDFFASGKGLNLPLLVKDYALLHWLGANSYRTSHYPYSEEEMLLADRQGFLIIDETPAVGLKFDDPAAAAERQQLGLRQVEELVARDKNHPCVIMWSVANEPSPGDVLKQYAAEDGGEDPAVQTGRECLAEMMRRARDLDPTRPATFVTLMGGPAAWMESCDVICVNRYWGWYVYSGQLQKAFAMIDQELDDTWERFHKPIILSEFGADAVAGLHGHPAVMWTEEYQADFIRGYLQVAMRKPFVAGAHVWNFADFAAAQSVTRVGGMNLKGVFTRARQPKLAAHRLRELWGMPAGAAPSVPAPEAAAPEAAAPEVAAPEVAAPEVAAPISVNSIQAYMEDVARRVDGKKPGWTTTLKLDFGADGIYRLVLEKGACRLEAGDGSAAASLLLKWSDAQKLFSGKIDPMVAVVTGKIKTKGDARQFLELQAML